MTLAIRWLPSPADAALDTDWVAASAPSGSQTSRDAPLPPGARRLVVYRDRRPVARVGFGTRSDFSGAPGVIGYVGWYAAHDPEAGTRALSEAAAALDSQGAERVIGPMDGDSWHRYRVAMPVDPESRQGGGEPFLSEPTNPPDWAKHFEAAGFQPCLEYETRRVTRPESDSALAETRANLARMSVTIRPLDSGKYNEELRALYDLSSRAFVNNPFYSAIHFVEFQALYSGLRPHLDPVLVRLASNAEGRLLGFVFAFPDLLGGPGSPRIVLKTLAVHEEARGLGLGSILVDDVHAIAAERGAAVLHALMLSTNVSRKISGRSASELFRRYVLYERLRP